MKYYTIINSGCDDDTEFQIELSDEQLEFVIKLFERNNINADYGCRPSLFIYEYNDYRNDKYSAKSLARDYDELKEDNDGFKN